LSVVKQNRKRKGEALVLSDKKGEPQIILDASLTGAPAICMRGEDGAALQLQIDGSKPKIHMSGKGGNMALVVTLNGTGISVFSKGQIKWTTRPARKKKAGSV
jgi:hypothetical protein